MRVTGRGLIDKMNWILIGTDISAQLIKYFNFKHFLVDSNQFWN